MTESLAQDLNKPQQKLIPESLKKLARRDLEMSDTPALVAYEAARVLCGPGIDNWETESVAHELLSHRLSLHDLTLNKIWCVMSLHKNREVLTSSHVFQKIVLALNNEMPNPQIDELVEVEQVAWALVVIHMETQEENAGFYFDYEPIKYMTLVLHGEGFIITPKCMNFAQESLTRLNKNPELVEPIQAAYKTGDFRVPGAPAAIIKSQLAKLERVDDYVHIMHERLVEGLRPYRKV